MARQPVVLEKLFQATSAEQCSTNFLIFSLLVPFIHREGAIGQQARDSLLLVMAASASHDALARYITENSYFCPVSDEADAMVGLFITQSVRDRFCNSVTWIHRRIADFSFSNINILLYGHCKNNLFYSLVVVVGNVSLMPDLKRDSIPLFSPSRIFFWSDCRIQHNHFTLDPKTITRRGRNTPWINCRPVLVKCDC